ncbi:aspartate aminotransferase family protein [Patescibacteria group bacterium]|nr:aspartate aminotransferase family protein [Patescibacteria group bacterium]
MSTDEVIKVSENFLMHTYSRIPIVIERGEGPRVWDKEGKCYLDFISGIGVMVLGYSHPCILKAMEEQAKNLVHCSNLYYIYPQAKLAEKLCELSFADKVFFSNSGAEANEAAVKLARKFGASRGAYEIVAMENSFHGRTLATLGLTGQAKYREGFGPFPPGFKFAPFNDLEGVKEAISPKTCAVIVEPIQGEGGINVAFPDFLEGLADLCKRKGILLILDEIQCGLGRTGKLFAYQHYQIKPDIMTLAKPLAEGLPIGVTLAKEEVASAFKPGNHASTFGGNPLVCAAGLAFLKVLEEEKLVERAEKKGRYFQGKLQNLKKRFSFIQEIRGKGLMLGMELNIKEGKRIVEECREKGLLINLTVGKVLRFIPPLIVENSDIDEAVDILENVFKNF